MGANKQSFDHGAGKHYPNSLDYDTHIANGSMRVVQTEPGAAIGAHPQDEHTTSVITPENHPHWETWNRKPTEEGEADLRKYWGEIQNDTEGFGHKKGQIIRSCPDCLEGLVTNAQK